MTKENKRRENSSDKCIKARIQEKIEGKKEENEAYLTVNKK